jgi:hypothetical protein
MCLAERAAIGGWLAERGARVLSADDVRARAARR